MDSRGTGGAPAPRSRTGYLNSEMTVTSKDLLETYNSFYFRSDGLGKSFFDNFDTIVEKSLIPRISEFIRDTQCTMNGVNPKIIHTHTERNSYINIIPKTAAETAEGINADYNLKFKISGKVQEVVVNNLHFSFHRVPVADPANAGISGRLHLKCKWGGDQVFIRFIPFEEKSKLRFSYVIDSKLMSRDDGTGTFNKYSRKFFNDLANYFIGGIDDWLYPPAEGSDGAGAATGGAGTTPPARPGTTPPTRPGFVSINITKLEEIEQRRIEGIMAAAAAREEEKRVETIRIASATRIAEGTAAFKSEKEKLVKETDIKESLMGAVTAAETGDSYDADLHIEEQLRYIDFLKITSIPVVYDYLKIPLDAGSAAANVPMIPVTTTIEGKKYVVFALFKKTGNIWREDKYYIIKNGVLLQVLKNASGSSKEKKASPFKLLGGARKTLRHRRATRKTRRNSYR